MGLVYITVGSVANIMFRNMGMPNDKAAFWSSASSASLTPSSSSGRRRWSSTRRRSSSSCSCSSPSRWRWSASASGCAAGTAVGRAGADADGDHRASWARRRTSAPTASTSRRCRPRSRPSTSASRACAGTAARCWPRGLPHASAGIARRQSTGSCASAWMIVMLAMGGVRVPRWRSGTARILPPGAKALDAPKSFGDAMKTFGDALRHVLPEEGHRAPDRLRVPLSLRLRPARQDGAAVHDRQPRQPRARAVEPGGGDIIRHLRHRRVHRRVAAGRLVRVAARACGRRCCCCASASTSRTRRSSSSARRCRPAWRSSPSS